MSMDRFKFRLWNRNQSNLFVYFDMMNPCEDVPAVFPQDGEVLEQCTDLKDKNKKLIYEGDILLSPYTLNNILVHWDEKYARWELSDIENMKKYLETTILFTREYLEKDGYEVIGNIHENPELLK